MKKEIHSENSSSSGKSVFHQAGELIGTIGAQIANGTGKVVDFVSDEATIVKKAIKKKLAKKNTPKKKPVKKTPSTKTKESSKKKSVKRATKRPVRKTRKS